MYKFLCALCIGSFFLISCSPNNVTEDKSLKKYFDQQHVNGCFALYDNGQGHFSIYNLLRYRDTPYLPASTFKIVNSLIGLQTGRVRDASAVIPWDGITRNVEAWNRDLTMDQAFRASSVPWFQELARRIGKDTMQKWLDTLGYAAFKGKAVIKDIDSFWLDNSVKITADEQLGLVKRLYFNQLPFYNLTHDIVKNMMMQENNSNYKLSYKTGWAHTEKRPFPGMGRGVDRRKQTSVFFVLQMESPDENYDMAPARLSILKNILKQYGFMEGRK